MHQQHTVRQANRLASVQESRCAKHVHRLLPASVRHVQRLIGRVIVLQLMIIIFYLLAYGVNHIEHHIIQSHTGCLFSPPGILITADGKSAGHRRVRIVCRRNHTVEIASVFYPLHPKTNQEAVPQGIESLTLRRQLVRSRYQSLERYLQYIPPVAECLFVQYSKQGILYGRSRLPNLVEESHRSIGQIAVGDAFVHIALLQLRDRYRTEQLIGRTEPRHQILERGTFGKRQLQPSRHHTLCHTRRAEQEHTLARHSRQQCQRHYLLLAVYALIHALQQLRHTLTYFLHPLRQKIISPP